MLGRPRVSRIRAVVLPGILSTTLGLAGFRGDGHLVLVAQSFKVHGAHRPNVDPRSRAATGSGPGRRNYFGPPDFGSAPRRPGAPAAA